MGVKLQDLVCRKKIDLSYLKGKIIAIDAPNVIMSLLNVSFKNAGDLMMDRTQRPISHLYGILYRVIFYYSKNLLPIFCFDGRVSELKRVITKDQLNDFRYTFKRYQEAMKKSDYGSARFITLSKEFFWPNIIMESRKLLNTLGVPYIDSPASAEAQCAELVKSGYAHYSNSQDYDSLLFGCPHIIQNLSKSQRRKVKGRWTYQKIEPQVIHLQETLDALEIDRFQLVDLSLLIETDFFPGIKSIGPKTALKLIKKYKSLEKVIIGGKDTYNFSKLSPDLISKVRKIFLLPDVIKSPSNLYWNPPDKSNVINLLCKDHHLNFKRVSNNLDKLEKNYHSCLQVFASKKTKPKIAQKTLDSVF